MGTFQHETFLSTQPDGKVEEHVTYAFTFILDRKTIFFNYVIVCPSICILIFILFLFMIPIQSNQRFVMGKDLIPSAMPSDRHPFKKIAYLNHN